MKSTFKLDKILLLALLPVLISSLWENNIYILFMFSVICWFLLPYKKWWDEISIPLLLFSFFYVIAAIYKGEIESKFLLISYIISPVAFYRIGRYFMKYIENDEQRQKLLLYIIGAYLLPLFLLTAQDIALTGLINDSRKMLLDLGDDDALNATMYGMMASVGIGCIGTVFAKRQNKSLTIGFIIMATLSLLSVIHLVNRTGLVICAACLFAGFVLSTRMNISKMFPILLICLFMGVLLLKLDLLDGDTSGAYAEREENEDADATNFGGRTELWFDAIGNMIISPFGWKLDRYAHNLWLDIARVGGWVSLILFVKVTIVYFTKLKYLLLKRVNHNNYFLLTLLSINIAMLLNAFVEPVIDGSILFFSLLMMFWGMIYHLATSSNKCSKVQTNK